MFANQSSTFNHEKITGTRPALTHKQPENLNIQKPVFRDWAIARQGCDA